MKPSDADNEATRGLDEYLDGALDAQGRQAFERRLDREPTLRAESELQLAINAALRRQFAAPSAEATLRQLKVVRQPAPARPKPTVNRWQQLASMEIQPRHLAAAAAILLFVGLPLWWFWPEPQTPARRNYADSYTYNMPWTTFADFYRSKVETGFEPDWECPPGEFQLACVQRLNVSLTYVPSADENVKMAGVAYTNTLTTNTLAMLIHVNRQPVIVFVDRADALATAGPGNIRFATFRGNASGVGRADAAVLPPGGNLKLHKRRVGDAMLYELSPFDRPQTLHLFVIPQTPPPC